MVHGSRDQLSNMSSGNQSPTKINAPSKSTINNAFQGNSQGNSTKPLSGDNLIEKIEEIERKALNEIEKLREEKIDLMKQLKHEIQSNN